MTQMLSYVAKRVQPTHYWVCLLNIINRKQVGLSEHVVWNWKLLSVNPAIHPSCFHSPLSQAAVIHTHTSTSCRHKSSSHEVSQCSFALGNVHTKTKNTQFLPLHCSVVSIEMEVFTTFSTTRWHFKKLSSDFSKEPHHHTK